MTLRRTGVLGLAIVGMVAIVSVAAACGGNETTTTVPSVPTTQPSPTTSEPEPTTTPPFPTITGVTPREGSTAGGTSVVITGTDFTGLRDALAVTFGGIAATAYTVDSPTQITATAPANEAGTVRVKVSTSHGASANTAADEFT
jgi:cytoskeletal protein RodZ